MINKIIPSLWYDKEAVEAAEFYTSFFPNSRIISKTVIKDTPSGDCDEVVFDLAGQRFYAISAGPYFKFNPAVSFILNFDPSAMENAEEEIKRFWDKLIDGGQALMPLQSYDFSPMYGWLSDKYGLNWQLILSNPSGESRPFITPNLMFSDDNYGKAEEARAYYLETFKDSEAGALIKFGEGQEPNKANTVMFSDFRIYDLWVAMTDSYYKHGLSFNQAVSFTIMCDGIEELDHYWSRLSHFSEFEQCGWCTDRFGMLWQVVPKQMTTMLESGTKEQIKEVTKAFMQMKKLDQVACEEAYHSADNKMAEIGCFVKVDLKSAWEYWNNPEHIEKWSYASDDWHAEGASNDLRVGGQILVTMAANDGSMSFEFGGTYSKVDPLNSVIYTMGDGRKVAVRFEERDGGVQIHESFETENSMPVEMQVSGWQSIMNNYKKYVEGLSSL